MEKNKTYKVWRMLGPNPSDNECLQIVRIRDCKNYLRAVENAYRDLGWKLIVIILSAFYIFYLSMS